MAEYRVRAEESFLFYSKGINGWTCPSCETELKDAEQSCFLCGCEKRAWMEQQRFGQEEERIVRPVYPEPKKTGNTAARVIIAIIVIALLIALFYFASQAAELEQIVTETEESLSVM